MYVGQELKRSRKHNFIIINNTFFIKKIQSFNNYHMYHMYVCQNSNDI